MAARSDDVIDTQPVSAGAFVLGMHRSGTSVVAGVVERLGLDGGPRRSMVSADRFNSDGYWEQRPLVDWHDAVLLGLGGWASAPPPRPSPADVRALAGELRESASELVRGLYSRAWFMKDPRQCLLLPLWRELRGLEDIAVVVLREPESVVRSLVKRNAYDNALARALWERYCHELLHGLDGRPAIVVHYRQLTRDPQGCVELLVDGLGRHLSCCRDDRATRVTQAAALVHADAGGGITLDVDLNPGQRALADIVHDVSGYHARFSLAGALPPLSDEGTAVIERRRRRLNRVRPVMHFSSAIRSRFDRFPVLRSVTGKW